ncbi:PBSX family phage terminase large subunit [Bacillus sp. ISL-26]|uniref:PBSX family phage terminase large subunit n=1 Tax=Bacillus sp. ISL-26 TaxID=2819119 RepID=UPI0020354962|nr:PBSX family phage terminase large subunit [Bacillus sp. ISL-26]
MAAERVKISEILSPAFHQFWKKRREREHTHYVLKGGRGSGKSFSIGPAVVMDIIEYPVSALVMRKVQHTIQRSVFEQIKQATISLGVYHLFRFIPSKLQIVYTPRGNKIYFAGGDDPEKVKSIKDAQFPIAVLWIEELAEFKSEDEVKVIQNSILREELSEKIHMDSNGRKKRYPFDYTFYYSYNPPKRRGSWVNKKYESSFQPKNTYVHHSTYKDNPFVANAFVEEAEATKQANELMYRWAYMGEAIGSGVVPFPNLAVKAGNISDELVSIFDNIRQGVDFAYAADPLAFVRWHYDKKKRIIYAIDEYYGQQISNRKFSQEIKKRGYDSQMTIADSAEPKSIAEIKEEHGIRRIKGAKKGPDSREFGERWLADLEAIVIDPKRTPNIAREFENADYEVDRFGDVKSKLQDKDDHTIDATRYAFEEDMKRSGVRVMTR